MKISTSFCVIGCLILMFAARRTEGVRCYFCTGSGCGDEFEHEQQQQSVESRRTDGVRCYFCTGSGCGDEFEHERQQIVECKGSCSKTKTDDDYVTRACVPIMNRNTGCQKYTDSVHCFCTRDLCNGATPSNTGTAVVVGLMAAICVILKLV